MENVLAQKSTLRLFNSIFEKQEEHQDPDLESLKRKIKPFNTDRDMIDDRTLLKKMIKESKNQVYQVDDANPEGGLLSAYMDRLKFTGDEKDWFIRAISMVAHPTHSGQKMFSENQPGFDVGKMKELLIEFKQDELKEDNHSPLKYIDGIKDHDLRQIIETVFS